jgi:hypothetical protein
MSLALKTIHTLRPAVAEVHERLGLLVFARGSLGDQGCGIAQIWSALQATPFGRRLTCFRTARQPQWGSVEDVPRHWPAVASPQHPTFYAGAEFAVQKDEPEGSLTIADLGAVFGMDRASYLFFRFAPATRPEELAALGTWALDRLPLWWGSGGWMLERGAGAPAVVGRRLVALAKRYWGMQVVDLTALQWDAMQGLPAVNWLTFIGSDCAQRFGLDFGKVAVDAGKDAGLGVFYRQHGHGIALAAGPQPSRGDINQDERLHAYVAVNRYLGGMMLAKPQPFYGPFPVPELLLAWIHRFSDPLGWLEADVPAS